MSRRTPDPVSRAFELIARYHAGEVSDEAEEAALLEIWNSGQITPTVEHAQRYTDGGWKIRYEDEWVAQHYPLPLWIEHGQRHGGIVGRRRVIVLEDWRKIPKQRTKET